MSIWKNIFCVITSPRYGWEVINDSNIPVGKVMRTAFMPLLIVLALSCFVPMIYDRTLSFSGCLMSGIIHFSAYFLVLLMILRNLLPSDFTPVLFFRVYLPWMAYRGTDNLFVKKEKVFKFVVISSALLLGLPLALTAGLSLFNINQ